jgi:hypothetical protein
MTAEPCPQHTRAEWPRRLLLFLGELFVLWLVFAAFPGAGANLNEIELTALLLIMLVVARYAPLPKRACTCT